MMKQKRIAEEANVSPQTVSNILNGRRRPSWRLAKKLAEATGTDVDLWMEGSPDEIRSAVFAASKEVA